MKLMMRVAIDGGSPLRYDKLYGKGGDDLNREEREERDKRRRLEEEMGYVEEEQEGQGVDRDRFLHFLVQMNDMGIKTRQVEGTQADTIQQVLRDHEQLETMLAELKAKSGKREEEWDRENQRHWMNETMEGEGTEEERRGGGKNEESVGKGRESVIEQLNRSLAEQDTTPDDVQNILIREREQ